MASINVSKSYIEHCLKLLNHSQEKIRSTLLHQSTQLKHAQLTWNDHNFYRFEEILEESRKDLNRANDIISEAISFLNSILAIISEYEDFDASNIYSAVSQSMQTSSRQSLGADGSFSKNTSLKKGLLNIEKQLTGIKNSLLTRNVQGNSALNAVIQHYRHRLQASLLDEINGVTPTSVNPPDFDSIALSLRENNLDLYDAGSTQPRNLAQTRYGFNNILFQGIEMSFYDDPIGTNELLIRHQGESDYSMRGTCGLCQCANIMTMAGVSTTENDIISIAMHSSDYVLNYLDLFDDDPDLRGGTTSNGRREILEREGIPITNLPINENRVATVRQLASAVATGHGVIVSVDVERLWRNGQSGGHAISLLSVSEDGSTFIYSDTGTGRLNSISYMDLAAALTNRPANITTNIIR